MNKDEISLLSEIEFEKKNKEISGYFKRTLSLLWSCENSLFISFGLNFFMSFQYYILVTLIPIYFTDKHQLSNLFSGLIFGFFGVSIGIVSLLITYYSERIIFKNALFFSAIIGIAGFLLILFHDFYMDLFSIIVLQAISCAISWPYLEYGIRSYSKHDIINMSSSLFYMCNYSAGIFAGVFIDYTWAHLKDSENLYLIFFGTGTLSCLASLFLIFYLRPLLSEKKKEHSQGSSLCNSTFSRYLVLILLLIFLRSACFGHIDSTFPKYIIRVMGDSAHFGVMLSVHSITIMLGIFFFTALTEKVNSYSLILTGGIIGSLSTFIIYMWDGYTAFTLTIIGISIGESLWVPRLLDYTYQIAPKNHEEIYLALSNSPFYFGMIFTGATSGILLDDFCSIENSTQCNMIWMYVFAFSSAICVIMMAFRAFLEEKKIDT